MASFFVMASCAKCKAVACLCKFPWNCWRDQLFVLRSMKEDTMKKILIIAAAIGALAGPALADEVGVRVGPVGAGVTVGESHRDYDRDRDRDRDRTVIREREPSERTTVIKKERGDGTESKTVIHRDND
jgi:hypothetical protein